MTEKLSRKITIVGPGALGCLMAGYLARTGCQVSLLDYKKKRAEALDKQGIEVETPKGTWLSHPVVTWDPRKIGPQDLIIILVKAYQTSRAITQIPPLIGPGTVIISLQNGIGHEKTISQIVDRKRIGLGITSQGATLLGEGKVKHAGQGPTIIGPAVRGSEFSPGIEELCLLLERAGWPARTTPDIYPHIWNKLIINVGINAITSLTGLKNGDILLHEETMELQARAIREAYDVAIAKGIDLGADFAQVHEMVREVCRNTALNKSSMLQDRIRKHPTEIDEINGAISRYGKELDMPTPVNDTLTMLVTLMSRLGWEMPQE